METAIVIMAFVFILLISVCSIGAITYMFHSECAYIEEGVESTLLTQGLAIIGMATAVWTGLNILNVITRKDLEKIDKRLLEQEERAARLTKKSKKQLRSIQESQSKPLFMQELLKTSNLPSSLYFYKNFYSAERVHSSIWKELITIEQCFENVYSLYGRMDVFDAELRESADKGLKLIQNFIAKAEMHEVCKQYLYFRKADLNFYKGYVEKGAENIYQSFDNAKNAYRDFLSEIGINTHFDHDAVPFGLEDNVDFAVFMANIIGESYSKISQNYVSLSKKNLVDANKLQDYVEKSIDYLEWAVKWSKGTIYEENEVIYRNLGCAYERQERAFEGIFNNADKIFQMYQNAFKFAIQDSAISLNRIRMGYYVLLNYYKKYIEEKLGIDDKNDSRLVGNCQCDDDTWQRIQEFIYYSDFILQEGRKYSFSIAMNGFAYFTAAVSIKCAGREYQEVDFEYCYDKIRENVKMLNLIEVVDKDNKQVICKKALVRRLEVCAEWI